jgi:hypothetical protein
VNLRAFNLLGEQLANLGGGFYKAGRYMVNFNGAGYPSGLVLVRLEAESISGQRFARTLKTEILK